jgi:hypothetical protein
LETKDNNRQENQDAFASDFAAPNLPVRPLDETQHDREEFAADMAAPNLPVRPLNEPEDERPELNEVTRRERVQEKPRYMGWLALILAVASLFVWPAVLGPAGAVLGFMALARGHRALGIWSIVIGLISFAAYFLLVPYYS